MTDQKIVELYLNRNEQAIAESQIKYGHYCYSIAYNILYNNEDSQECVNDTFLGAWNSIPPHKPVTLTTYLGKITRRLAIDSLRHTTAQKRGGNESCVSFEELESCIPSNVEVQDLIETKRITEILNDFLKDQNEITRKVFVCRYWYMESVEEIAQRFHFSNSKVKMMLKRTRDKLAIRLKEEGVYL